VRCGLVARPTPMVAKGRFRNGQQIDESCFRWRFVGAVTAAGAARAGIAGAADSAYDRRVMQPSLIVHGGAGDWSPEEGDGALAVAACSAAARAGLDTMPIG
jgi:hypothetical protein